MPAFGATGARAGVVVFPGSNGDRDLAEALSSAGFSVVLSRSDEPLPRGVALLGLPGGFSYGDYWRAGMLASRDRAVRELPDAIASGTLVLGICNGFQILVEAGLLDGALTHNAPPGFCHRWVTVEVTADAQNSPWFFGLPPGTRLRMPMANAEGRYYHPGGEPALLGRVPLRYLDHSNGSLAQAAALCDQSGRVLGVMPHPERACDPLLGSADGQRLLGAAAAWLADGKCPPQAAAAELDR